MHGREGTVPRSVQITGLTLVAAAAGLLALVVSPVYPRAIAVAIWAVLLLGGILWLWLGRD